MRILNRYILKSFLSPFLATFFVILFVLIMQALWLQFDKIAGKALQAGIDTRDCLLLTSGRISSEMLSKARRMNIPVVVSRTAPTSTSGGSSFVT